MGSWPTLMPKKSLGIGPKSHSCQQVPTSKPQETILICLIIITVGSLLVCTNMFTGFGLRLGSSWVFDLTRNTSPEPHLHKVLPCRHSWDLGLGTLCESALGITHPPHVASQYEVSTSPPNLLPKLQRVDCVCDCSKSHCVAFNLVAMAPKMRAFAWFQGQEWTRSSLKYFEASVTSAVGGKDVDIGVLVNLM